jgi:hypothetical protein
MNEQQLPPLKLRIIAASGLFFLSPFVAEFLLGNIPITMLWLLPILALLYGGGCLKMLQECFYFLGLVVYFSGIGLPVPDGRKNILWH